MMKRKMQKGAGYGARLACGLLLAAGQAVATPGSPALPDFKWPVEPTSGMYFDPTQPGNGLGVELMPVNGQPFFFGAFYHYSPDGAPTWFTFQSFLHQASKDEYVTNGVVATIDGPWIVSNGGQCFDCAYAAPSTVATPFQRRITVIGARHLQMAASGNAAALNMQRTEAVIAAGGQTLSQALLTSGTVWAVTRRDKSSLNAPVRERHRGWVRFRLRPAAELHAIFSGFQSEPGTPPTVQINFPPPAWLVVNGDPNTAPQYEAKCVLSEEATVSTVGPCSVLDVAENDGDSVENRNTFLIDPITDRIRFYNRCVGLSALCNRLRATPVHEVADVIEATPARAGEPPRLVIRRIELNAGHWWAEYELRPVSAEELAAKFPNGVPAP